VFDEKKAFKIIPVVVWKRPELRESISQQWFNAMKGKDTGAPLFKTYLEETR
jgi:hypothetical protein